MLNIEIKMSLLAKAHFWIIRLIAGKTTVILNAHISIADIPKGENEILKVQDIDGALINNNNFSVEKGKRFLIKKNY